MKNNLLLIGSESHICQDFLKNYSKNFDRIVGIDFPEKSSHLTTYLSIDFRQDSSFGKIEAFLKELDLIFPNVVFTSGINYMNDTFGVTLQDWNSTFDVNVKAALFSMKAIYSHLSDETSIVFMASQNGVVAHEQRIDYGPAKSALIQLAKNLSVDYAKIEDKDIRVNTISPSYIINDSNRELLSSNFGKRLLTKIPYKKFVTAEDVSRTIFFLLSENSRAMRGQNLILDYGYTIV
ncbi:SDR family NAD(P)-dependent oxidoreductase [Streptococcus ratti]|uniref:Oxidoreductase n=1 Tax=Streptococcus ratti FA-1 = DSM 20564 TaxID=699248 RepID=A0ABP2QW05_STRRT|nr:SDR family oxidoreductase [Streptococcus ratti]EJN93178.1 putative oxidoreductase [Streptococcus ratti FA-1 = DSM 20564]EMP70097.1 oxidoreductase [Streptococcus ratti FA-1 = DSM 20564]QEY06853.1 SDR family oxidoreductase [Streptococcus ratti]VEI59267.1 oxidoreductase [Streptococcus mutans]